MTDHIPFPMNSILVIGGGTSSVIAAVHLLRAGAPDLRVTVEKRTLVGRGIG